MLRDRLGDAGRFAVVQCVIAAHRSLQLGEFGDHVGDEVRLRQQRGAIRERMRSTDARANVAGEKAQSLHAIVQRAELVVIDDAAQALDTRRERLPAVLVVEEFRVRKSRAQHALVAVDDRRSILAGDVAHEQEAGDELAVRIGEREILLVLLHRQDQALLRDGEKRGIERPFVHGGPFDERGDFVEQCAGHDHVCLVRAGLQRADDHLAAAGERRQHLAFRLEGRHIRIRGADCEVRAREKAMAGADPPGGKTERRHADDIAAVQRDEPWMRGSDEFDVVVVAARRRDSASASESAAVRSRCRAIPAMRRASGIPCTRRRR